MFRIAVAASISYLTNQALMEVIGKYIYSSFQNANVTSTFKFTPEKCVPILCCTTYQSLTTLVGNNISVSVTKCKAPNFLKDEL